MSDFNSILYEVLGARIKARREELGINQNELSDNSGIGRTSISNIEQGRQKPPLSVIYQICNVLNIDVLQVLPSFTDIQQQINFSQESFLKSYLDNLDIDKKTMKEINSTFNQTHK